MTTALTPLIPPTAPPAPLPLSLRSPPPPLSVADFESHARLHLPKQVYDYYRSGANDELTLSENVDAFKRIIIRPRCLVDVTTIDSMQCMAHPLGEIASARAAAREGTAFCLSSLSTTALEVVAEQAPGGLKFFQLYIYRDRAVTLDLVRRAEASGFQALVLTVDTPFIGTREADVRNGFALPAHLSLANFPQRAQSTDIITDKGSGSSGLAEYSASLFDRSLTWEDLRWLKGATKLPIVIKGILTREDALRAVSAGAAAIVVSNHGARQLDTVAATIEALDEVVRAVEGKVEVWMDGGVRRGTDVLKALALGARAVFIGRPILWGLAYAGEAGARAVHQLMHKELELAMALAGAPNIATLERSFLTTKDAMRPKL